MFLCDTNVISELARPLPSPDVFDWITNLETIFISVITLEEIQFGIAARPNDRIPAWFDQFLQTDCVIVPVTEAIAIRSGQLRGSFRRSGQQRTQADILIAFIWLFLGRLCGGGQTLYQHRNRPKSLLLSIPDWLPLSA
jgi:toxin FitB